MYQVWFTELVLPVFTQAQRDTYRDLVSNQIWPIGNVVGGRHLLRCLTDDFTAIETFLNGIGKQVMICDARYQSGIRYGYEQVQDGVDGEGNPIYIIQPILDADGVAIPAFGQDMGAYNTCMQDVEGVDSEGNPVTITPSGNTSAGWAGWEDRV